MFKNNIIKFLVVTLMLSATMISPLITSQASAIGNKGDVLVTLDGYFGLPLPGHAAIVYNSSYTVESYPEGGVRLYPNDWTTRYSRMRAGYVKNSTLTQAANAANFAYSQIGKPYNYNFNDKTRTDSYYCSQLVWRAYYNQGFNLDPDNFSYVAPYDIALDSDMVWYYFK